MSLQVRAAWTTRPCAGEVVSGDVGIVIESPGLVFAALVDALGHGWNAHNIARRASAALGSCGLASPASALEHLHEALRGHGGVCASVLSIDVARSEVCFAGVGNVQGRCFGSAPMTCVPRAGALGVRMRPPVTTTAPLSRGNCVLLYTDGVSDRAVARLDSVPHGARPDQLAAWIVHQHGKADDDASCLAVRCT